MNYSTIRDLMKFRQAPISADGNFGLFTDISTHYEQEILNSTYYCFGYITQGALEISIDGQQYEMGNNSILVYRPGQSFKVSAIADETKGAFILFTKKFLDSLRENIFSVKNYSFLSTGAQSHLTIKSDDFKRIKQLFDSIFQLLSQISTPRQDLVAKNLASALVYETDSILENYIEEANISQTTQQFLVEKFNNLIEKNFRTSRKIGFYANKLNVTANYLYIVIKKTTGSCPTALINHRVITEAQKIITDSEANVSEIAYSLNFDDPAVFSKFFKKNTGISPSAYRQRIVSISTYDIEL